jgi:hypothetical protein
VRSAHRKVAISIVVVAVYTLIPFLSGRPASTPDMFQQLVGGVPLSALLVVFLLIAFPTVAWLCASMLGAEAEKDGE